MEGGLEYQEAEQVKNEQASKVIQNLRGKLRALATLKRVCRLQTKTAVMGLESLSKENLSSLLSRFQGRKILVIGDLIVSRFVEVAARKLSREAPVPAGDYVGENFLPGGGANLARELSALGAAVSLIGVVGDDEYGRWLKSEFQKSGVSSEGVVTEASRPTSLRTWIMVNGFHSLRIDREDRRDVPFAVTKAFVKSAEPLIKDVDCVILSDYDRGVITSGLISGVVSAGHASGKIIVAQPKMRHYLDFTGVTYVKSNLQEATNATGMSMVNETSLRNLGVNLIGRLDCKSILVTRGEEGMTLFERESVTNFPPLSGRKNVFSKVGVRDAMTGVFALGVASGGDVYQATSLSNLAGTVRSQLQRNSTLSIEALSGELDQAGEYLHKVVQAPVRR
jgi:rfaE bifunctional protein kinase chain/domain